MISAFIGVIGSGKDYRAAQLTDVGHARVDFKDGLLDMASDLAGYDVRKDYDWFKENIVGVMRPQNKFVESFVFTDRRQIEREHPELLTGRRLLQRLGTEVMRKRDSNYWVKEWLSKVTCLTDAGISVVTADCRFPNEYHAIASLPDSTLTFCDYRSPRYSANVPHESEAMAQALLRRAGLRDGEHVLPEHILKACA